MVSGGKKISGMKRVNKLYKVALFKNFLEQTPVK